MFEYFLCLDLLLLSRLHFLRHDTALGWKAHSVLAACQSLLLVLSFRLNLTLLLIVLLLFAVAGLTTYIERQRPAEARVLSLLVLLFGIDMLVGLTAGLQVWPMWTQAGELIADSNLLTEARAITGLAAVQVAFGFLLLLNEVNAAIRIVFQLVGITPQNSPAPERAEDPGHIDQQEWNAGRVIGFLERWLVYIVILASNDLQAIGLILAAKSLARMKQMDDKAFAEYVLIGTLLSVLSAVLVGRWVLAMLA
ncbi:MAG: hypothetical protein SV422_01120 [Pseudomonadota bacterium]|nr:hypothetical protein [Pseudomonadota bacterium]